MSENGKVHVSAEDFVEAWQLSETRDEVADRLGQKKQTVVNRAKKLVKAGVRLKEIRSAQRGRSPLDVSALNDLIDQIR